jgi:molybdopterin converting factor small subunit
MARTPKVSYAETVAPLLATAYRDLATPALMTHLDALRAECARIFAIKQAKAETGEVYLKEADAVAELSDRYCEAFAYAEERLGVGRTVGHYDLGKPADRAAVLAHHGIPQGANER